MKTAVGYLRVSGKGQLDGDGFPRQRTAIEAYAKAQGLRIVHWFEERGVTGTNDLDNRPALQEVLSWLAENEAILLIEKLDRLARDLMIQESIIADFKRKGFEIVSVAEPDLCCDDPTRTLMRQMMGAFSQYEKTMIVSKLRSARRRIREKHGRCEGRKPFGFHPSEQPALHRMHALRSQGLTDAALTRQLNAEGFATRSGGLWFPASVARILRKGQL